MTTKVLENDISSVSSGSEAIEIIRMIKWTKTNTLLLCVVPKDARPNEVSAMDGVNCKKNGLR